MTKEELQKRLKYIAATPLPERIAPRDDGRRDANSIDNIDESAVSDFDSFFDFEEDIADLESARQQTERFEAARLKKERSDELIRLKNNPEPEEESFLMFEEDDEPIEEVEPSFIMFEEEELSETIVEPLEPTKYNEVKGFDFKYCKFIKSNGEQCKRQSPKIGDYCGTHRKLLDKQS